MKSLQGLPYYVKKTVKSVPIGLNMRKKSNYLERLKRKCTKKGRCVKFS
jgi:hypothetical protein